MQTRKKGTYCKKILDDYCVVDLETTGLSSFDDSIIEIGILRVRQGKVIEKYSQLINPKRTISAFITKLTGITNEMVKDQPTLDQVKNEVFHFIGEDVILGHNTSFDLGFLANQFDFDITNGYMDTLRLSRKVFPELSHHRLTDMVAYLHLSHNEHRSIADCIATHELYEKIKIELKKEL